MVKISNTLADKIVASICSLSAAADGEPSSRSTSRVLRLSNDVSHLVAGRGRLSSSLRSARSLASLPPYTSRKLRALIVTELVVAKQAQGFLLAGVEAEAGIGSSTGEALPQGTEAGAERSGETIYLQLCCICPFHPAGVMPESLVQCRIECSPRSLSVEYSWPKGCNELGKDNPGQIVWHDAAEVASRRLESFIAQLLAQDEDVFALYKGCLPLLADVRLEDTTRKLQQRRRTSTLGPAFDQAAVHVLGKEFSQHPFEVIAHRDWLKMTARAKTECMHLPCLTSCHSPAQSPNIDPPLPAATPPLGRPSICSEADYQAINKVLRDLLCKSLLRSPPGQASKKSSGGADLRLAYIGSPDVTQPDAAFDARPMSSPTLCLYTFVGDALILLEFEPEFLPDEETADDFLADSIFAEENTRGMRSFRLKLHHLPLPAGQYASSSIDLLQAARDTLIASPTSARVAPARAMESSIASADDSRPKKKFSLGNFKSTVLSNHLSNLTRVLFYAARNGVPVQPQDVRFCLEQCSRADVEVDIAAMCRWQSLLGAAVDAEDAEGPRAAAPPSSSALGGLGLGLGPPSSSAVQKLASTFLTTIGTKMSSLESGQIFVLAAPRYEASVPLAKKECSVSPSAPASVNHTFASPANPLQNFLLDLGSSLNDCACIFASFYISCRGLETLSTASTPSPLPSSALGVAQAIVATCSSLGRSKALDSSGISLGMQLFIFPAGAAAVPVSMTTSQAASSPRLLEVSTPNLPRKQRSQMCLHCTGNS